MGSNAPAPDFKLPDIQRNLSSMGGKELEAYAKNMLLQGLDPRQRAMLEGNAAGSLRSGEQGLREQFAGMGNAPVGAQVGAQTQLRSNLNKNLQQSLLQGDLSAKQQGFQNWTDLGRMAMGISGAENEYGLKKTELDNQPGFLEGLLQSVIGAAGQAGGAAAASGACCFIFMEAYNGNMPYWVRQCRDEFAPENTQRRIGYIKMSKWLVPLMKKSKTIRFLVNSLMIKPLTKWGGYYKKVEGYKNNFIYKPFVKFWFKLWELYA